MIVRMIIVNIPPERSSEAEALWKKECAPLMIQQPGCLSEQFLKNSDLPAEYISLQTWEDQKSIDAYHSSPAHQEILRHTRGLLGVSKVEVKSYDLVG